MAVFNIVIAICSGILTISNVASLIRSRVIGVKQLREGQKCLLRSEILHIYYKHLDDGEIPQFRRQNVDYLYKAYKELGGNSFIDDVYEEIRDWKIISSKSTERRD